MREEYVHVHADVHVWQNYMQETKTSTNHIPIYSTSRNGGWAHNSYASTLERQQLV